MADIELIIKIPERIWVAIQNGEYCGIVDDRTYNAIKNGIALPKGHGRLIDADEIQFENAEFDTYGDYSRAFDAIDGAETIIGADNENTLQR